MTTQQSLDKPPIIHDNSIFDDELENVMATEFERINALAAELAELSIEAEIDDEYEALMDVLYAEHEAMMYAANSYDNDAIAYGEMV